MIKLRQLIKESNKIEVILKGKTNTFIRQNNIWVLKRKADIYDTTDYISNLYKILDMIITKAERTNTDLVIKAYSVATVTEYNLSKKEVLKYKVKEMII